VARFVGRNWKGKNCRRHWPMSLPLLWFAEGIPFTLADAFEAVQIYGATGSGKTSGSGRQFALAYLLAGMGGLVLTAKPGERELWESYCRETGRLRDLVIFSPTEPWRLGFLDYELHRGGRGAGLTENLVNLFSEVLQVAERRSGGAGREDEGYWVRAMRQLIRNCIDLLILATDSVSIPQLYRLVVSLPTSRGQVTDRAWQERSFAYTCLKAADRKPKSAMRNQDFGLCADYALLEFPALSEKTRSIIVSTFTSMVDVFQRSVLRELFCTTTNITPDATSDGKIILMDLPVKEFGEVGQLAQVLMKYLFMRAIERRPADDETRPVFLFADESQNFTSEYDFQFQATARSARVCTVYLTQNLPNYYATLGASEQGRAIVDSLMGNLNTKILHANSDPVTNEWAANLIGRSRQYFVNTSRSQTVDVLSALLGLGGEAQSSGGINEVMEFECPPRVFTTLRRGGEANAGCIDAIVFQGGRRFADTGRTWRRVTFQQRLRG
jgi:hypothetical protein